ncbi:hypothetical protein [Pseudomonas viciae]|uniref:hypothetical protein n=1 Tax=Pseudomonas viciae TaxID=2505979 RepID=UPI002234CE74|nr:hypothetical protein [Pseudomonas viciae]UZE89132.1 hypothetical protein LOY66_13960 [Pseudomonas viciae]
MASGFLLQQALVDQGPDVQGLVDERVDVHIALAGHLQCVMKVLQLLADDRVSQRLGDWQVQRLARHLWLVKAQEPVALLQAQKAIELFLAHRTGGGAEQRILEAQVVGHFLQAMAGGIEVVVAAADHQGTCELHVERLIFPKTNRFDKQQRLIRARRPEQSKQFPAVCIGQLPFLPLDQDRGLQRILDDLGQEIPA